MTLKEKYRGYFDIGAAVNTGTIVSHNELITREFSSITCENEMKYNRVTSDGKTYNFADADAIAEYAKKNGLKVRMHTLLWHNQVPDAIFEGADKDALLATLKAHTQKIGERYGKLIYVADVANEVVEDKEDYLYRRSKWYDILGDTLLDEAFAYAAQYMPGVKLCYNDYNEMDPVKSKKIYELVKGLLERGAPVHTLGLQAHWSISTSLDDIKRALELYSKLGVSLQVTEMDISVYPTREEPAVEKPSADMIKKQVQLYRDAFALFREYKDIMDSVTTWGVADDMTWLSRMRGVVRKNWPLLFDDDHQPKEAYHAIMDF
ncbi:MAG: endo-1,4-beta-xylanase [Oscillospiraceae bacterium]|nr:endo-1,4-beta-xylanase [Oscillospiraceae bacterium]